jgi:hypothetical protein
MKCPFCQFDNEDGALFCEQCKSDLGVAEPVAVGQAAESQHAASAEARHSVSAETHPAPEEPPPTIPVASESSLPVAAVVMEEVITEAVAVAEVAESPAAFAETLPPSIPVADASPAPSVPVVEASPVQAEASPPSPPQAEEPAPPPPPPASTEMAAKSDGAQAAAPAEPDKLAAEAKPKLVVVRGQRVNAEYPIYEGDNYIGRADEKAVDIDLEDQEPQDRIWSSRQHALITLEDGKLTIEDLNSTNGTFINRMRLHPNQKRPLLVNDVIQIGTVQMKVKV